MEKANVIVERVTHHIYSQNGTELPETYEEKQKFKICSFCSQKQNELNFESESEICCDCRDRLCRIPSLFRKKDFTNFIIGNNQIVIKKCKNFFNNDRGIFLYGNVGTGKTHLAISILKNAIRKHKEMKFVSMSYLFLQLRNSFNSNDSERWNEQDIVEFYENGLVLFDDFATEKQSEYSITTIYTLLNKRYINNQHKIVITSNLPLQKIAEIMSDRIASRICEMCEIVEIKGEDFRVKK